MTAKRKIEKEKYINKDNKFEESKMPSKSLSNKLLR